MSIRPGKSCSRFKRRRLIKVRRRRGMVLKIEFFTSASTGARRCHVWTGLLFRNAAPTMKFATYKRFCASWCCDVVLRREEIDLRKFHKRYFEENLTAHALTLFLRCFFARWSLYSGVDDELLACVWAISESSCKIEGFLRNDTYVVLIYDLLLSFERVLFHKIVTIRKDMTTFSIYLWKIPNYFSHNPIDIKVPRKSF